MYKEQNALLSPAAQKRVYDVRKCLQATLEPLIRHQALPSHTTCYLTTDEDALLNGTRFVALIAWTISRYSGAKQSFCVLHTA